MDELFEEITPREPEMVPLTVTVSFVAADVESEDEE
ncbi:hypothetical protein SAMN05444320_102730 [Streptoalloteichus hindustanus]|uniref:Uncharacterized protein n=1 Tax=Streptoalloteichus hindustanus TaxID=2017 RepID=A0A1M4ZH50_STRHI|nr:hypothetical protein SAMN05444320_102730 [Streptoalloteichus hindustanus]